MELGKNKENWMVKCVHLLAQHITNLVAVVRSPGILRGKFEDGDIVTWLHEFDTCAEANGWNVDAQIKKL